MQKEWNEDDLCPNYVPGSLPEASVPHTITKPTGSIKKGGVPLSHAGELKGAVPPPPPTKEANQRIRGAPKTTSLVVSWQLVPPVKAIAGVHSPMHGSCCFCYIRLNWRQENPAFLHNDPSLPAAMATHQGHQQGKPLHKGHLGGFTAMGGIRGVRQHCEVRHVEVGCTEFIHKITLWNVP